MNPLDLITRSRVSALRNTGNRSFRQSNLAPYRGSREPAIRIREELRGRPEKFREKRFVTRGERYYIDAMANREEGVANWRDRRDRDTEEGLSDAGDDYQRDIRDRAETSFNDIDDPVETVTFTDEEAGVITGSAPKKKKKAKKKSTAAKKIESQGGSAMVDKSAGAPPVEEKVSFLGFAVSRNIVPGFLQSTGAQLLLLLLVGGGVTYAIMRARKKGGRSPSRPATASNPRPSLLEHSADREVAEAAKFRREFHWGNPARRVVRRSVHVPPRVLADLGEVSAITYRTKKRGEKAQFFEHEFERRRPRLGVDPKTKRLHLVGGTYTVKAAGITG
jgi:hypothetical protein